MQGKVGFKNMGTSFVWNAEMESFEMQKTFVYAQLGKPIALKNICAICHILLAIH